MIRYITYITIYTYSEQRIYSNILIYSTNIGTQPLIFRKEQSIIPTSVLDCYLSYHPWENGQQGKLGWD